MKKWILFSAMVALLASCEKENRDCPGTSEKQFSQTGFTKILAGETFNISVTKGDAFSIKAKGCTNDLADLELKQLNGGFLEITYTRSIGNRPRVDFEITMPSLVSMNLTGAAKGTIDGFGGQTAVIRNVLSGASECTVNGTAANAQVELSGSSILNISGSTLSLYGTLSGAAQLNGYGVQATEVDLSASGASRAYVKPIQILFAEVSGDSRIFYRGNPPTTNFVTSGNGRIVQE